VAAVWVKSCAATLDTATCGAPQRLVLAFSGPAILFGGGIWAFVRTYRVWRSNGTWWGWHGSGWFLLMLMLITLTIGATAIDGSAFGA
jgi:hypothetical protein